MSGNFLSCSKCVKDPYEFPEARCIRLETPQRKRASSGLEWRTSRIFSSVTGALDLRRGPQGPALLASGKASPHASYSGASWVSSPIDAGA